MPDISDTSGWRLTSFGGSVKMRLLDMDGEFEQDTGGIKVRALIRSVDLFTFLSEAFPPPLVIGNVTIPQRLVFPGLPGLVMNKVSFKNQDGSRPSDPFGIDPTAPSGTYHDAVEVTMDFGPREIQEPDENDPNTFLEVSAATTGDYLHTTAPGAQWRDETAVGGDGQPGEGDGIGLSVGAFTAAPSQGATSENRNPTTPVLIIVPETEWTVKWNHIPWDFFRRVLIHRLRYCIGRVNDAPFSVLFNAEAETILLLGYTYQQNFSWRDGTVSAPPISVEMKFLEKRIVWEGIVRGHNHFWKAGEGWKRLEITPGVKLYQTRSFDILFRT